MKSVLRLTTQRVRLNSSDYVNDKIDQKTYENVSKYKGKSHGEIIER